MQPLSGSLSRRRLLFGAAATVSTALIAACGSGSSATNTPKPAAPTDIPTIAPSASPTVLATIPSTASATAAAAAPIPATTPAIASTGALPTTGSASAVTNVAGGTSRASSAVVGTVEAGDLIKDAGGHFTFTGPKGWAANPEPSSPAVVMLRIERPFRALRVNESAPSEGKSLQQYAKDTLTVIKTNSGFRKGTRELQSTTLGGEPAIIDDFVVEYANVRVLCIRQGIVYTVFFSTEPQAADALQPVVRLVLDTWKFL